ncbi:MAG: ATP phosphoribosyltransferase [Oscillospiraceae bacterium]|nr:ATP phosphoribosyltransferase [Oscillospiraceae bacterium]
MINIALPKGRLGDSVYKSLEKIGYECPGMLSDSRKLVFENSEKGVRYILVKPSDVAVYVEHGVADIGIVGYDVISENEPDVFELFDLDIGKCSLAVAAPKGFRDDNREVLRVATKYPNVAKRYYSGINREIEIIELHGSIELAPIIGLSDVIVDIVETGTTLRENGLEVCTVIEGSSARLIANKSSYQFKRDSIEEIISGLGNK